MPSGIKYLNVFQYESNVRWNVLDKVIRSGSEDVTCHGVPCQWHTPAFNVQTNDVTWTQTFTPVFVLQVTEEQVRLQLNAFSSRYNISPLSHCSL